MPLLRIIAAVAIAAVAQAASSSLSTIPVAATTRRCALKATYVKAAGALVFNTTECYVTDVAAQHLAVGVGLRPNLATVSVSVAPAELNVVSAEQPATGAALSCVYSGTTVGTTLQLSPGHASGRAPYLAGPVVQTHTTTGGTVRTDLRFSLVVHRATLAGPLSQLPVDIVLLLLQRPFAARAACQDYAALPTLATFTPVVHSATAVDLGAEVAPLCTNGVPIADGSRCERCLDGATVNLGARCNRVCDCPAHRGVCAAGVLSEGSCDVCTAGHYGAQCIACLCSASGGTCDDGNTGTGVCTSCNSGFAGATCSLQCPTCTAGTACDSGTTGSGQCVVLQTPAPVQAITVLSAILGLPVGSVNGTAFAAVMAGIAAIPTVTVRLKTLVAEDATTTIVVWHVVDLTAAATATAYSTMHAALVARDPRLAALRIQFYFTTDITPAGGTPVPVTTPRPATVPVDPPVGATVPPGQTSTSSLSTGALAGIVIGGGLALVIFAVVAIFAGRYLCKQADIRAQEEDDAKVRDELEAMKQSARRRSSSGAHDLPTPKAKVLSPRTESAGISPRSATPRKYNADGDAIVDIVDGMGFGDDAERAANRHELLDYDDDALRRMTAEETLRMRTSRRLSAASMRGKHATGKLAAFGGASARLGKTSRQQFAASTRREQLLMHASARLQLPGAAESETVDASEPEKPMRSVPMPQPATGDGNQNPEDRPEDRYEDGHDEGRYGAGHPDAGREPSMDAPPEGPHTPPPEAAELELPDQQAEDLGSEGAGTVGGESEQGDPLAAAEEEPPAVEYDDGRHDAPADDAPTLVLQPDAAIGAPPPHRDVPPASAEDDVPAVEGADGDVTPEPEAEPMERQPEPEAFAFAAPPPGADAAAQDPSVAASPMASPVASPTADGVVAMTPDPRHVPVATPERPVAAEASPAGALPGAIFSPSPAVSPAGDTAAPEKKEKKKKRCKHCGNVYDEVPDECPVTGASHRIMLAERKKEKKEKKARKAAAHDDDESDRHA